MKLCVLIYLWLFASHFGPGLEESSASLQVDWAFKFENFSAGPIFNGKPAPVRLQTEGDRLIRTTLREAAHKGTNFAGHYAVAKWGCGSGCKSFALIDLLNGRVYANVPFSILTIPSRGTKTGRDYQGILSRADSRLLIADGCPGEDEDPDKCGTYYYEWTNHHFKLLHFDKVEPRKEE